MDLFGLPDTHPVARRIRSAATRNTLSHALLLTGSGDRLAAARLAAVEDLEGEPIIPAQVTLLKEGGGQALLQVIIHQGKNRQIRRMCAQVGLQVKRLRRVGEESLTLGNLPAGKWRYLRKEEIAALKGKETP